MKLIKKKQKKTNIIINYKIIANKKKIIFKWNYLLVIINLLKI